ncbi:LysM peptidoglycan-binding domain-containing protein [Bacillus sp. RG28]|uniref:LysM peptidoglycan-binding domain-containing protein n=1 Tax=Gottfriedia endophytica TaxID=2820819 RepID=A0A940NSY2_9BACI|nr:3D domain-containing protein [Gottfriedia endophytica]MBP0726968.1 LysM peptidoglycan-binding domain-containing protein [Gottfriedia endophytica]
MKKIAASLMATVLFTVGFSSNAFASTYKVKEGDSLWKISHNKHVSIAEIKKWNRLSSDNIKPNQILQINPKTSGTAEKTKSTSLKTYKVIKVRASAYTATCKGCSGKSATGINLKKNPNLKVISVDPRVIPLGSKVYVEGYGYAIAADTGGAIKGNRIDILMPSEYKANQWGIRTVTVKVYK